MPQLQIRLVRGNLPDHSTLSNAGRSVAGSTLRGSSVHIAAGVERHDAPRVTPVQTASEVVQGGVRPSSAVGSQLENRPVVERAVKVRGAIHIALSVKCQVRKRSRL